MPYCVEISEDYEIEAEKFAELTGIPYPRIEFDSEKEARRYFDNAVLKSENWSRSFGDEEWMISNTTGPGSDDYRADFLARYDLIEDGTSIFSVAAIYLYAI